MVPTLSRRTRVRAAACSADLAPETINPCERWSIDFIQPGRSSQKCFTGSFNGKVLEQSIDEDSFVHLIDTRIKAEA